MSSLERVGIYSGTFDPVHVGHIEFALIAAEQLSLDKVLFLPERSPREKQVVASFRSRQKMLQLATKAHPKLQVCNVPHSRFTVKKTLPYLQTENLGSKLVFLLGSDVVKTFAYRWKGLKEFLQTFELCIGLRTEDSDEDIEKIITEVEQHYGVKVKYKILPSPKKYLASTSIRQGINLISDIDPSVADYIAANGTYSGVTSLKA